MKELFLKIMTQNFYESSIFSGFYIRDGVSVRLVESGVEKVPSIFISRLVPNGLAAMTGLLAVDDEVLEVNSIEVTGKTLDQVFLVIISIFRKKNFSGHWYDGREFRKFNYNGQAGESKK